MKNRDILILLFAIAFISLLFILLPKGSAEETKSLPIDSPLLPLDTQTLPINPPLLPIDSTTQPLPINPPLLPIGPITQTLPINPPLLPIDSTTQPLPINPPLLPINSVTPIVPEKSMGIATTNCQTLYYYGSATKQLASASGFITINDGSPINSAGNNNISPFYYDSNTAGKGWTLIWNGPVLKKGDTVCATVNVVATDGTKEQLARCLTISDCPNGTLTIWGYDPVMGTWIS